MSLFAGHRRSQQVVERAERHPWWILAALVLVVLVFGAGKLWIDPPSTEFNLQNRWWQIALNVEHGRGYTACKPEYFPFCGPENQQTAMREPLPVLVYAGIAWLTTDSLMAAAAFGVALNAATLVCLFFLGRELHRTVTGLIAAFIWALYLPPVRLYYDQVSGDLFATFAITLALFLVVRAQRTCAWTHWAFAGVCFGIAILSRSATIVVVAALAMGFAVMTRRRQSSMQQRGRRLSHIGIFALACALTMSPWVVRNTIVFDQPVVGSTLSGYYLYRQHHMLASDDYLRFVTGGEFEAVIADMVERRDGLTGTENEAEMDAIYREEALTAIRHEPFRYVALSMYRGLMLWFNWDVKSAYSQRNSALDLVMMAQQLVLKVAGIVGVWKLGRRAWPLVVSVIAFSLIYMAVQAHLAYIIPVMPLVVALVAVAVTARRHGAPMVKSDTTSSCAASPASQKDRKNEDTHIETQFGRL